MDSAVLFSNREIEMSSNLKSFDETFNEGGEGFNPHQETAAARAAQAAEARMANLVLHAQDLRAAWNAAVAKYTTARGVSMSDLAKIEREVGATRLEMVELKARGAI